MKCKEYIIEVLKNNKVIRKSGIVCGPDLYCAYEEIKKSLNNGKKINIRLVIKE